MSSQLDVQIQSSKSILNRSLIIQSFNSEIVITGGSDAEDVKVLKGALSNLSAQSFDCASAGTSLRFLTARLSRLTGKWEVRGTERLFTRPQVGLIKYLEALGIEISQNNKSFLIQSGGWKKPKAPLKESDGDSSQFMSAIILSSWQLDFDLEIQLNPHQVSQGYLDLTLNLSKQFGLVYSINKEILTIAKGCNPKSLNYRAEIDMSSAFVIATLGVFIGNTSILSFPMKSLQPDSVFLEIFDKTGIPYKFDEGSLKVAKAEKIKPVTFNLSSSPDLFPVLLVLCAHAEGVSILGGAPHLKFKESNRWEKGQELLRSMKVEFEISGDEIAIHGKGLNIEKQNFKWNPDLDHRWAFAAGILKKLGWPVDIANPEVIDKSFPNFWKAIGLKI